MPAPSPAGGNIQQLGSELAQCVGRAGDIALFMEFHARGFDALDAKPGVLRQYGDGARIKKADVAAVFFDMKIIPARAR